MCVKSIVMYNFNKNGGIMEKVKKIIVMVATSGLLISGADIYAMWKGCVAIDREEEEKVSSAEFSGASAPIFGSERGGAREGKPGEAQAHQQTKKLTHRQQLKLSQRLVEEVGMGADENMVHYLIGRGAQVNYRNGAGETALMNARTVGVINALVAARADVNVQDKKGKTALIHATSVCWTSECDAVKALIQAKANVDTQDESGWTALMSAYNHEAVLELIEGGADVHLRDRWGKSALIHAFDVPYLEISKMDQMKLLIHAGAFFSARDKEMLFADHRVRVDKRMKMAIKEEKKIKSYLFLAYEPSQKVGELWAAMPDVVRKLAAQYLVNLSDQNDFRVRRARRDVGVAVTKKVKQAECVIS